MNSAINGKLYEDKVWKVCNKIKLNNKKFCTMNKNKLGSDHDIICNNIKKNDLFINDTIAKLYSNKGCSYIQISKYGLYHLEKDICKFNVPYFKCKQVLRKC
jgi:hypothetical protein